MRSLLASMLLVPLAASAEIPTHQFVRMDATAAFAPYESRTDDVEPDYRAFSSMEATDDGRIIYWGGGHGNYGGNDMDVYHVAENQWRQETYEENWKTDLDGWDHLGTNGQPTKEKVRQVYGSGPVADYLTGRGRPGTRHVYQQATWWPEKGWFVFDFKHSLWAWNPEQGDENGAFYKIHDGNANQGYADIQFWNIRHDPPSGSLISFNTGDKSVYRLRDGAWQKVMDVPFDGYKGEVYSEFHEADRVHYAARWSDLFIIDLEGKTATDIPDSPPQAAGNNQWIEYSPEREQMLVMGFGANGLGVWGYNPAAQQWEAVDVTGEVIRPDGNAITNSDIRWDMLERDPVSGNFYLLSFRKGAGFQAPDMYAFRLSEDAGQPAPADPSPHPKNQWVTLPIPNSPGGLPSGHGKDFQIEWREATGNLIVGFGDWLQNDGTQSNGNEHVYSVDAETGAWTILVEPCNGNPQPEGWDEVAIAIRYDELWGFPGFGWGTDCTTDIAGETMALGLSTGAWRVTGHGHLYTNDDTGFGDYDPVTDRFYIAQRPGIDSIDPTDPEAGRTRYSDGNDYRTGANQLFLDVQGRAAYLTAAQRGELIRFDLETQQFSAVTQIPDGARTSNAWAVWDRNHRVILAPPGNMEGGKPASGVVYAYHVDLAKWQRIEYPDDGTVPFGNSVGYDVDSELLVQMGTKTYPELQSIFALEYDPEATGEIESWVTGETDPDPVPEPEPEPTPATSTLTLVGTGPDVDYTVEFESAPTKNGDMGSINDEDVIDGTTATGQISTGTDAYDFEGTIVSCTVSSLADMTASVDGQPYDGCTEPEPEPAPAPEPSQIAITGGQYHVVVGDTVVSDHFQLKEAVESAVNQLLAGKANVRITRDPSRVELQ